MTRAPRPRRGRTPAGAAGGTGGGSGTGSRSASAGAVYRGVRNEGGFLSPYYLFDLMERQHHDELDFDGRERERHFLPRAYRKAMARLDARASVADVWREWYRELFHHLDLEPIAIEGVTTVQHGFVPVSHAIAGANGPICLVDLHPLTADLDHDGHEGCSHPDVTREPIARAFELALDAHEAPWGILSNGTELRLYRRGSSVARQYLAIHFESLFDADRNDEWTAFWGLCRRQALTPGADGKSLLERVLEESQRHARAIADDLRANVVDAIEALVNGVLGEPRNRVLWGGGLPDPKALERLFEESLYFLYRLLFILYSESRDVLPVGESRVYHDTYSVEHLRSAAERDVGDGDGDTTYFAETLRTLFRLLRHGCAIGELRIPALGGHGPEDPDWAAILAEDDQDAGPPRLTTLFDGRRTLWLDRAHLADRALRTVIRELSLSRPQRRNDRRERYSYADLGVDQLGSIYEGLLVYEPTILDEEHVIAKIGGEDRMVPSTLAHAEGCAVVEGSARPAGSFVLRLWGGRRKGSGSYYTPQEITAFLVREALEPKVAEIIDRASIAWREEQERARTEAERTGVLSVPTPHTRIAEEVLDLKVCDPAVGSGAFLVQACRYLAEAYGRALIAEGRKESGRIEQDELLRCKRRVVERCLYGVDMNPLAVELAKVSLWLETLAVGRPLSFLDAHLRCGNSLLGAPLRDSNGLLSVASLVSIPRPALVPVLDDLSEDRVTDFARAKRRNDAELRQLADRRQPSLPFLDAKRLEETLAAYAVARALLQEDDAARSPAEALALRDGRERSFREAHDAPGSTARRLRDLCDLWCAAWFWPEEEAVLPFTTDAYRGAAARLLDGETPPEPFIGVAVGVARSQRFFHWELEFPEVFLRRDGGFDAIVGNPPWEEISDVVGQLASEWAPLLKRLRGDERQERIRELVADPVIGPKIGLRARVKMQYARFAQEGPLFAALMRGKLNTFAPFAVLAWSLHRRGGAMALVLKDAFHQGETFGLLRHEFLTNGSIRLLATSDNERLIFDAHHLLRFDLIVAARGHSEPHIQTSVHRFRSARQIVEHARDGARIPLDLLRNDEGQLSEPIPEIVDSSWTDLWKRAASVAGPDRVLWTYELNSSGDKSSWQRDSTPDRSPGLVLGMVAPFNALGYRPYAYLVPEGLEHRGFRRVFWNRWRPAVRKRANQKDERVLIGGLVPPHVATCDFLKVICSPELEPIQALAMTAVVNALFLDYLLRPFILSTVQTGLLNRVPWLLPAGEKATIIAADVYALLAGKAGYESLPRLKYDDPTLPVEVRRARLDARVAALYGLSTQEFAHVLASFGLLDQDQPPLEGEPKSFITRDRALLELCRLRGEAAPDDIVTFFAAGGADISAVTGSIRGLEERVSAATALGAIAYLPSRRTGRSDSPSDEPRAAVADGASGDQGQPRSADRRRARGAG